MKRLIPILLAVLTLAGAASAQTGLDGLRGKIRQNRVSFSYSFSSDGKVPFGGRGRIIVQGAMYVCEMEDGGKIWCDGKTRWTLDRDSREIYVEDVASSPDILSDPDPYIASLRDVVVAKDGKSLSAVYDNGKVRINVSVSSIAELPAVSGASYFTPDTEKYSASGWAITDLR